MPDHGREVKFGHFLTPSADGDPVGHAQQVERLGLDLVGVQDHPYQRRFVDTWVLMSMIAASTERLRIFPDVANLPLRPPAMMAKAAASIDTLSGGRFELGLGAGAFWDAIEAYGGRRRTPGEAIGALAEAIEVIRLVWSGQRNMRFRGDHYHLAGAHSGPVPAHRIGIWLGVYGPRALRLAGRSADGWVPTLRDDLEPIVEMTDRLDDAALEAERDPGAIRRVLNINGTITAGPSSGLLQGPVAQWADQLTDLVIMYGFDSFIAVVEGEHGLERFANEVVPLVREQVAVERSTG